MSVVNNTMLLTGDDGYQISRSVRLRSAASAYLNRTPASAGNRKTMTFSMWLKRGVINTSAFSVFYQSGASGAVAFFSFDANNTLGVAWNTTLNGLTTTPVYRDPSSWYHIVVAIDTPQATASNRIKVYVNGVQVTSFSAANYPTQNVDTLFNTTALQHLGSRASGTSGFDGYLTEINFVDGQALTPTSFGETDAITGVWKPKKYAGTYGTNGFYLNFSDNSAATAAAIGADSSGNGNNWTPNNISVTAGATYDSMIDVPTPYADGGNGRGNYAVLNPLDASIAPTNGNLQITNTASHKAARSSIALPPSGLFYAECTAVSAGSASVVAAFALQSAGVSLTTAFYTLASTWGWYHGNGRYINRNGTASASLGTASASSVYQIAVDCTNGNAWLGVNNTWYDASNGTTGSPSTLANPTVTGLSVGLFIAAEVYSNTAAINFGQRPFAYTPPTGFKALNTQNLPESTVVDGGEYFNTVTYSGDNTSPRSITGVGFSPDLVWIKSRSNAVAHRLSDSVRGANKALYSNLTDAEDTDGNNGYTSSFDSDGFTLTAGSSNSNGTNGSGYTYVAWNWKANGTGVSNTDGSITSTVSANTTAGFSVVTYTGNGTSGATIGHGLGVAPKMIIVKGRNAVANSWASWQVYHSSLPSSATSFVRLDETAAAYTGFASAWNSTNPTSSVFSVSYNAGAGVNGSGDTFVAYCFSEVAGYSKFGSYTGNGSADGPFVFCGFRPRFVMYKRTDSAGDNWNMLDTTRSDVNVADEYLFANSSSAEGFGATVMDILSNGFKLRFSGAGGNASGGTYIFMAFAEHPFKNTLAR